MSIKKEFLGKTFESTNCGKFVVIEADTWNKIKVRFIDTGYEQVTRSSHIRTGSVRDPYHPIVFGVGFQGKGKYKLPKYKKIYTAWYNMMIRCYDSDYHALYPTYKECAVCEEWRNFQIFAEWYEQHSNFFVNEKPCLDKDIINKGNKIYSPESCCLVPVSINNAIIKADAIRSDVCIGVRNNHHKYFPIMSRANISTSLGSFHTKEDAFLAYKEAKESYIKELANKHKDIIKKEAYESLINYQVEYESSSWINE